jgi:hypothetical protein
MWQRTLDSRGHIVLHVKLKCPKKPWSAAPTVLDVFKTYGPVCPDDNEKKVGRWFSNAVEKFSKLERLK